jgi:hypothetical protein
LRRPSGTRMGVSAAECFSAAWDFARYALKSHRI